MFVVELVTEGFTMYIIDNFAVMRQGISAKRGNCPFLHHNMVDSLEQDSLELEIQEDVGCLSKRPLYQDSQSEDIPRCANHCLDVAQATLAFHCDPRNARITQEGLISESRVTRGKSKPFESLGE